MTDIVTGTPAVVGFTSGNDHGYNHGWTDKDALFARTVDAGEQTRDILKDVRDNALYLREATYASTVAIEKTGAANALAIEKVGAAGELESAKNAAALHVQIATAASASAAIAAANQQAAMMYANTNASAAILFAAQNQAILAAQIAECCCEQKALVLSIDAQNVRDRLALLQTQFMMVTGGLTPAGVARIAA
jgi:hypothetical protein